MNVVEEVLVGCTWSKYVSFRLCRRLNISLGSFFDPVLDRIDARYVVNNSLQVRMIGNEVGLGHVVQVVQNADEVQIGPCEL